MESRELFLSLHLLSFHWVEGWGGSDKKASLSLLYSLARLFILQTDTMFQKLCPSCSHASLLGVSKKGLFSNSSLSPSFFLTQEKRGGVVERGGRGTDPPLFFHWRAWDPRQACARSCSGSDVPSGTVRPMSAEVSGVWNGGSDRDDEPEMKRIKSWIVSLGLMWWQLPHPSSAT